VCRSKLIVSLLVMCFAVSACSRIPVVNWFFPERGVNWTDTRWCVPPVLKRTVAAVSRRYGPVIVSSTKRHKRENRLKGGAKKSWHLKCKAVDFVVKTRTSPAEIKRFLRKRKGVGGVAYYSRTGHFHIDTGPRRTW
jgi:uncharacterized protein YcbK (DUF882 family)